GLDPGDIVAYGRDFPAAHGPGRDEHGEVGLAASRRKCGCDIALLALRRLDAQYQHVLRQPALVACHGGSDTQRETLLAQQRVSAVARAVGPDLARLREMHDVLVLAVAWPAHIGLSRLQ